MNSPVRQDFLLLLQPPQVFTVRGFEALFPRVGTLGCVVSLAPQLFLLVYLHENVGPSDLPAAATLPAWSSSCHLSEHPVCPSCPSLPLLPVWMKVSSLTPWLLDFHTVQFSGSSGCIFSLNWLLSFFWLCKETKCIYLCLHLGWKSELGFEYPDLSLTGWLNLKSFLLSTGPTFPSISKNSIFLKGVHRDQVR